MANDLRVVIDTGVAISASLLPRSAPRRAFDAARQQGRILVSEAVLIELDDVFRRPKFDKYVRADSLAKGNKTALHKESAKTWVDLDLLKALAVARRTQT
jgi:predicted nucleic acid-binding protein